jgi:hypothetical protein
VNKVRTDRNTVSSARPTKVCLTVDVEFSIAGAFADPKRFKPVGDPYVWCTVAGKSQGLGFVVETLRRYGLSATFFVEALHRGVFVNDPMQRVTDYLLEAGQDVQLHLHPCWTVFGYPDWPSRVRNQPRQDDFAGRSRESSVALIHRGLAAFKAWGVPKPIAIRTASLQHDEQTFAAISEAGLPLSSSIGIGIYRSPVPDLCLFGGCHIISDVHELPVLSYRELSFLHSDHMKSLTVTGCSLREMTYLLWETHRRNVGVIVLLTHPFEFVEGGDYALNGAKASSLNQARFRSLCAFLDRHRKEFQTTTFTQIGSSLSEIPVGHNPDLSVSLNMTLQRVLENRTRWALA